MRPDVSQLAAISDWLAQFGDSSFIIAADLESERGVYYLAPQQAPHRLADVTMCSVSRGSLLLMYRPIHQLQDWRDGKTVLVDCRAPTSTKLSLRISGTTPVWSPDAQRLAFSGYLHETDERCAATYDATTREARPLWRGPVYHLAWSQDARLMALVSSVDPEDIALVQLYPQTTPAGVKRLDIDLGRSCWGFDLSPQLSHVCYYQYAHPMLADTDELLSETELSVVNLRDRSVSRILNVDSTMQPLWTQDGRFLFYAGFDEEGQTQIKMYSLQRDATAFSLTVNEADDTGEIPVFRPYWLADSQFVGVVDYQVTGDRVGVVDVQTLQVHWLPTSARIWSISPIGWQ